jgi:hypothetical protein
VLEPVAPRYSTASVGVRKRTPDLIVRPRSAGSCGARNQEFAGWLIASGAVIWLGRDLVAAGQTAEDGLAAKPIGGEVDRCGWCGLDLGRAELT